jgi:hypothetical protein
MELQIADMQKSTPFDIESIDVDSDRDLQQKYGHLVPVLECNGEEICRYYLDEKALTDYFRRHVSKVL